MSQPPKDVADRLFQLPPRDFVAERNRAVAHARAAGDSQAASALAALRRPTVAAWMVNLLALRRPELVADLVQLANSLRHAQQTLQGEQLRELAHQRRALIEALVRAARLLAQQADPQAAAGTLPLAEVQATLAAALADTDVAEQLHAGRLQRAVAHSGFGAPVGARLRLIPGEATEQHPPPAQQRLTHAQQRAIRAERDAAKAALATAEQAQQRAGADKHHVGQQLAAVQEQLDRLQAQRAQLARDLAEAEAADVAARRQVAAARRRLSQAEAEVAADAPPPIDNGE